MDKLTFLAHAHQQPPDRSIAVRLAKEVHARRVFHSAGCAGKWADQYPDILHEVDLVLFEPRNWSSHCFQCNETVCQQWTR